MKLSFIWAETIESTPGGKDIFQVQGYYINKTNIGLEVIPGASWSEHTAVLKAAERILAYPVIVHKTFESRLNEILADSAKEVLDKMFARLDEAEYYVSKQQNVEGFKDARRIERLRNELKKMGEAIELGSFEIFEYYPIMKNEKLAAPFPEYSMNKPYTNSAANIEPEYFREIFLNPEQDIPFALEALTRLEFIDENQTWRVAKYPNPLGPIVALIEYPKRSFFHSLPRVQIERAFCDRFKIKRPGKGFESKNNPFEKSKQLVSRQLRQITDRTPTKAA